MSWIILLQVYPCVPNWIVKFNEAAECTIEFYTIDKVSNGVKVWVRGILSKYKIKVWFDGEEH